MDLKINKYGAQMETNLPTKNQLYLKEISFAFPSLQVYLKNIYGR